VIERGSRQGHGAGGLTNSGEKFPRPQGYLARIKGTGSYTGFRRTPLTTRVHQNAGTNGVTSSGLYLSLSHRTRATGTMMTTRTRGLRRGSRGRAPHLSSESTEGETWPCTRKERGESCIARRLLSWRRDDTRAPQLSGTVHRIGQRLTRVDHGAVTKRRSTRGRLTPGDHMSTPFHPPGPCVPEELAGRAHLSAP
jgi:hypothetical protein